MFGLPELVTIGLVFFLAAPVVFMLMSPEKAKLWLSHDWWGLLWFALGIAVFILLFLLHAEGNWVAAVVAVGSFVAGCGLLMGLPDWISDVIIQRSNVGYVLIVAGIGVAFYYAIIPILPNVYKAGAEIVIGFEKGLTVLISDGKASQIFALVAGFVMVIVGAVLLNFKKRSK